MIIVLFQNLSVEQQPTTMFEEVPLGMISVPIVMNEVINVTGQMEGVIDVHHTEQTLGVQPLPVTPTSRPVRENKVIV